ncbi:MAG: DNA gyrase subunit A [Sphingobacteriales bacterium]|nr:DNA gyrase subunit A [Sphingobacteriales bacterium]MCC7224765.1 DNA gyrase subunit A [Chitinophagales bacterium]
MEYQDRIVQINIEEEMKTAYIDYSMSVIVSRALPDVRDGLKPVQRRVIYGMDSLGLVHNKPHKKSARIVGEVLGKFHPHGDSSVYDAMVRMAQDWSLRYPLVDGQGNFGSVDGDSPAAMRYTEARMTRLTEEMIGDLDKDTVDYQLNFDDSLEEPTVLPAKFPNLLVNGASGIAVGMATNMLPHNMGEIIDATIAYIDNRDITTTELCQYVQAPDFPTGGIIYGIEGVRQAFETGRGRVVVRGKAEIEAIDSLRDRIVITEIPYQINKSVLVKKIADLVNEKKIDGITDLRDESDRNGMRIVCDLRRDVNSSVILNQLYNYTALQTSFGVNNVCLVKGRPRLLNLKELIAYFVEFRHEVVTRRCEYELRKARERAHILEGFLIALDHLDEVIALIRRSETPDLAREGLINNFGLSEIQAREILNMRLQRLTGLERDKIRQEYDDIMHRINWLLEVLGNEDLRMGIIKDELAEIRSRYADSRRTAIEYADGDLSITDIIDNEHVALTISHLGYIKRTSLTDYREQGRGGKGSRGGATRDDDFIEHLFVGSTHDYLLIFTELGKCYWLRVYDIPEGNKTSKGRAIQNLINIDKDDKVRAYLTVENLEDRAVLESHYIIFATQKGIIKKTSLLDYSRPRTGGIRAINIAEGDTLLEARLTNGKCDILLGLKSGRAVRFPESKVRPVGRAAMGVIGITLSDDVSDAVVGMVCIDPNDTQKTVLSVSEHGFGKRTPLAEYRLTNRGGKGVVTLNVTERVGQLIALKQVTDDEGLMIICKSGIAIRLVVSKIAQQGRNTQGSRLINLHNDDQIASVEVVPRSDNEEDEIAEMPGNTAVTTNTTTAPNSNNTESTTEPEA